MTYVEKKRWKKVGVRDTGDESKLVGHDTTKGSRSLRSWYQQRDVSTSSSVVSRINFTHVDAGTPYRSRMVNASSH